ncbi:MAG: FG-GAP repeat domain-containing protein [Fimbriiglobus sp.]
MLRIAVLTLLLGLPVVLAKEPAKAVGWQKTVVDDKFRSEGVAVADVNKDGKKDIFNGEYWYEAPNWTKHEMQPPMDHKDGEKNYSRIFASWAEDLNADGYSDLIVIDFPGAPCYWMENPGEKLKENPNTHWRKHILWHSACNETPLYMDLLGTGKKVLIMGMQPKGAKQDANEGQMAYFSPSKDPYALWEMHPISEPSEKGKPVPGTFRFSHGLGVGDVNGDSKADVLCTGGWWEQPTTTDGKTAWKFHPVNFGEACADMIVHDVDGDGKADVITTSAHKFGIWWYKQRPDPKGGEAAFTKMDLFPTLVSETHAAHFHDIDGDGQKDLITGKRWWSHGRSEPGSAWSAKLFWFKMVKEKDGITSFTPYLIDEDCGVGTQFEVTDMNGDGLLDIVVSNKRGVRVVMQKR